MTSEYLKQLKLTKQLEQKAREAAKNRKVAEDRLAEAEREVDLAKRMGADVAALEAELAEGRNEYTKRDYVPAAARADKAVAEATKLQAAKVEEVLASALGVVAMIDDKGEDHQAIESLLDRSRKLFKEGRKEEAMAAAHDSKTAAEQYADRRMSEMFAQLGRLIDLGEREKVPVAARRHMLAKAVHLLEEGDRVGSLSKAVACFKSLQEEFFQVVETRAGAIMELADSASQGADISSVTALVDKGKEAMERGRIEEALRILDEAHAAIRPILAKAVEAIVAAQRERDEWLQAHGASAPHFAAAIDKATEAYAAGDSEEALELLRRSEKALRESEMEVVLKHIEALRPRMVLAKRTNLNLDRVISRLEEARAATVYGRAREALGIVDEVSAELDDILAPVRRVERELDATRKAFLQARRMRIVPSEASRLVAKAREDALAGRLGDSYDTLAKARAMLTRIIQERCARQVFNCHLMVAAGISIGADIEEKAEDLDDLTDDLREGVLDGISSRLATLNLELEAALIAATWEEFRKAAKALDSVPQGTDLGKALDMKRRAQELLEKKDWYGAHSLAESVLKEVERARSEAMAERKVRARALMDICRKMGIESQTLEERLVSMEASLDTGEHSFRQVDELILYAKSLARDEVSRALAQVVRASTVARKKGVSTAHVDRLTEEASLALADDDLERGFIAYEGAKAELQKTSALHSEVYDLIVLLSRLSSELHLPADGKIAQQLQETKRLFEAGLYDGARTSARACYREAESVGAVILAPRSLKEAWALLPVMKLLGIDTAEDRAALDSAAEALDKGDASAALAVAKEETRKMSEAVTAGIRSEIEEVRSMLAETGCRPGEGTVLDIVDKAESLLSDERYSDALQAARFARSEATQYLSARASAGKELNAAAMGIRALEALRIDMSEAREILDQARKHRLGGRCNLVAEIARNALQGARAKAGEHIRSELARIERELNVQELRGADLGAGPKATRESILDDLDNGRFSSAHRGLEIYRESLADLRDVRSACIASLSKLAEVIVRMPASPYKAEVDALMGRAQHAFDSGAFHEALALTEECRAAGATAVRRYQMAEARMEEARQRMLGNEGRKAVVPEVADLLDAAERALAEGRYESMDALVLRAIRVHGRQSVKAGGRAAAELTNAAALLSRLGLPTESLPTEARNLLDRRMTELAEERNLKEVTGEVRSVVRKAVEDRIAEIRQCVENGQGDMGAARSSLSSAQAALEEGRLEAAIELSADASASIGATLDEVLELRDLGRRYMEQAALARALGCEEAGLEEYRLALTSEAVGDALVHLRAALGSITSSVSACLPSLALRGPVVVNEGQAPAIEVTVNGLRGKEAIIAPVLWPRASATIPPAGLVDDKITVIYRVLFLSRPMVQELERKGTA